MSTIEIWTDGSSVENGTPFAKAGWACCFNMGGKWFVRYGNVKKINDTYPTNNRGEIAGVLYGLLVLQEFKGVSANIFSDSQYVINSMTKWRYDWERDGNYFKNQDMFLPLFKAWDNSLGRHTIQWVKGHSGVKGNEMADKYASRGMQELNDIVDSVMYDVKYVPHEELFKLMEKAL